MYRPLRLKKTWLYGGDDPLMGKIRCAIMCYNTFLVHLKRQHTKTAKQGQARGKFERSEMDDLYVLYTCFPIFFGGKLKIEEMAPKKNLIINILCCKIYIRTARLYFPSFLQEKGDLRQYPQCLSRKTSY